MTTTHHRRSPDPADQGAGPADPAATRARQGAVLAKIRKILAKAEDPAATAEEAQTYTAKAAALVAAYGIDRALLAERLPDSDVVGDTVVVLDAPYALDKAALLSGIAHALRCQAVRRVRRVGPHATKEVSIHLFGYHSDLERVELLFTSLLLQAGSRLARTSAPPFESLAAYRRSWLAGFTGSVTHRLRQAEAEATRDAEQERGHPAAGPRSGRSVDLVLRDRSRAVEDAVGGAYPRLGTAGPRSLSGSGGRSGWTAGERADLGGPRFAAPVRGRLGT